jgi:hypothetical protein
VTAALATIPTVRAKRRADVIPDHVIFEAIPEIRPERAGTIDDAINIIKVKHDVYGEVIELLRNLKVNLR